MNRGFISLHTYFKVPSQTAWRKSGLRDLHGAIGAATDRKV